MASHKDYLAILGNGLSFFHKVARRLAKGGHILLFSLMSSVRQAKIKTFKISGFPPPPLRLTRGKTDDAAGFVVVVF